jgi:hypothetical protein
MDADASQEDGEQHVGHAIFGFIMGCGFDGLVLGAGRGALGMGGGTGTGGGWVCWSGVQLAMPLVQTSVSIEMTRLAMS